jgi:ATP-dependent RNA helicase DDX27
MEANKAVNMLAHEDEIAARPAKSWFQTPKEKIAVVEAAKEEREKLAKKHLDQARAEKDRADGKPMAHEVRKSLTELLEEKLMDKTAVVKHGDHRNSRKKKRREQMLTSIQKDERRAIQAERDQATEQKKAAKAKGKRPEKGGAAELPSGPESVKRARDLKTIMEHQMGKQKRQKVDNFNRVVRDFTPPTPPPPLPLPLPPLFLYSPLFL